MKLLVKAFGTKLIGRICILALLVLPLLAVACGGAATPTNDTDPASTVGLSGTITIDGSSTVFPITEAMAEEFGILTGGSVRVAVGVSGTGGGFGKFCRGETDITNASRPIKASEVELCEQEGIEFIEIPVAVDGLTVMVHPDNDFVECLTVAELGFIWSPAAEGEVKRWNQVRPEWPDGRFRLYGPGVDSGTFDYFTEVVNGEAQASRGDFTASEDDNVLVQGISGDKNSLGFFGFAFFSENSERLNVVQIDGGAGCITPSEQTINDGSYSPLSRPLFIYVTREASEEPFVKEFIRFYLGKEGHKLVTEVGYVPYPPRVYELALARFENGKTGAIFGSPNPQKGPVEKVLEANQ